MNESSSISNRALNEAEKQARHLTSRLKGEYNKGNVRTWRDVQDNFGMELTPELQGVIDQPITSVLLLNYLCDSYVNNTRNRLVQSTAEAKYKKTSRLKLTEEAFCYVFSNPNVKLYREQDPVFRTIYDKFYNVPPEEQARAIYQNGGTGSGKTKIGCAVIDKFLRDGRHKACPFPLAYPIIWCTVKNAIEQTRREIIECGMGEYLDTVIHVISYSALTSGFGDGRLIRIERGIDEVTGKSFVDYEWELGATPLLFIGDEFHAVARSLSKRTRAIRALDQAARALPFLNTKFLCMSATMCERVNDMRQFICMADIKYAGTKITYENFGPSLANIISPDPDAAIDAANERLFNIISDRVVEIPYMPWPCKMSIAPRLYEFLTPTDRDQYNAAMQRYANRCFAMGRDPSKSNFTEFVILRNEVEPFRSIQMADEMYATVQDGYSTLMGTEFTGSILKAVFHLMDHCNVKREQISIVWGGRKDVRPNKILTIEDILEISQRAAESEDGMSREDKRLIKLNLAWQEDRLLFGETDDEAQRERYKRLVDLGLVGMQSQTKRQAEIDKYMSGQALYFFYTAASGGTGLSLPHKDNLCRPRRLWTGPIYSGKVFIQLIGRPHRRNSISDTHARIGLMNRTIESAHVAPILDNKLRAAAKMATKKFDISSIFEDPELMKKLEFEDSSQLIRKEEDVITDAYLNEDSQLHATDIADDDDDDEDDYDNE